MKVFIAVSLLVLVLGFPTDIQAQNQAKDRARAQSAEKSEFKIWWISLSIAYGVPVTGMIVDSSNDPNFDLTGQGTSWHSIVADLAFGITPFKVTSRIALGFLATATFGVSSSANGTCSGTAYSPGYWPFFPAFSYGVTCDYSYFGVWMAISPLFVSRFSIAPKTYANIGIGPSFWKYETMDYKTKASSLFTSSEDSCSMDLSSLKGSSGIFLSFLCQVSWQWLNVEVGFTGPDLFLGVGCAL